MNTRKQALPIPDDKPKHKNIPGEARRFQARLFVWIILTFLAAFYPLLWLMPPYVHLTPFVYLGVSLLWIPFAVRHVRRYGMRWLTLLLMVGCIAATILSMKGFQNYDNLENAPVTTSRFSTGIVEYIINRGCTSYTFTLAGIDGFPIGIVTNHAIFGSAGYLCALF